MRRFLRFVLRFTAVAYPVAVAAVVVAMAFVGERWWPTTVALYLPRALFAAPLPFVVLALLVWGPRWMLLLQAAAAALILFPLMGLHLGLGGGGGGGGGAASSGARLRVLSCNVDYGLISDQQLVAELSEAHADVLLLQASDNGVAELLDDVFRGMELRRSNEFTVASRYPIKDFHEAEGVDGQDPAFVAMTLETPLGALDVFSAHPLSPRGGLQALRGRHGLRAALTSGELLHGEGSEDVQGNTAIRAHQVAALAASARAAKHPVIIAGDTNLPGLSPLFREQLGGYRDGFAEVGRGFGYTFPAHRLWPWMRIDRILASHELRFLSFAVGRRRASDHFCVMADLAR